IDKVMGISKAYCTRVGNGPFPTELDGEEGRGLREAGQEFGATTGRPRRCGWIDLVALNYAVRVNGVNELTITKLDILNDFEEIKLCTAYTIDGEQTDLFPVDLPDIENLKPRYKTMPGWQQSLEDCDRIEALPEEARAYLEFIQSYLGVDLAVLSKGPRREETIVV
ncbi:MAG TPA: adenylosuccinate synthetase, partial [Fodinibius sp.]|nr:adenylosuccinate synthetase [Fodinibius sp.]